MSEYRPKQDADAVLESVRRIVAHSGNGPARAGLDGAERLVLTPAQRIDPTTEALPPETDRGPRRDRVQTRTLAAERVSLEARIAELEAAVGDRDDWEPDGSEPGDAETPRAFVFTGRRNRPGGAPEAHVNGHGPAQTKAQTPAPANEAPVTVLRTPEPLATPAPRDATASPPAADKAPASADLADGFEDSVIDEAMLRTLVSEIVRAELQGELGERITRNVRKLVRREIHRALMTRDLG